MVLRGLLARGDGAKKSEAVSIAERGGRSAWNTDLGTLESGARKEEGNGGVSVNIDSNFG